MNNYLSIFVIFVVLLFSLGAIGGLIDKILGRKIRKPKSSMRDFAKDRPSPWWYGESKDNH